MPWSAHVFTISEYTKFSSSKFPPTSSTKRKKNQIETRTLKLLWLEYTELGTARSSESSNLNSLSQEQTDTVCGTWISPPQIIYTYHRRRFNFTQGTTQGNLAQLWGFPEIHKYLQPSPHSLSLDLKGYPLSRCLSELGPYSTCNWRKWTFAICEIYSHYAG